MLKIYTIPLGYYAAKLRILLRHKDLQWQEILPPGGYKSDEYKKTVPSGNLPAMVDGGLMLADSEAIAEYLNDIHPEPPMLPSQLGKRGKARELSRFHDTRLEPELRVLFPTIPRSARNNELSAMQFRQINERLRQLGEILIQGQPWLNQEITLGDCGYPICFAWLDAMEAEYGLMIKWPEPVVRYRSYVEAYPAVAAELEEYRVKLSDWLKVRVLE